MEAMARRKAEEEKAQKASLDAHQAAAGSDQGVPGTAWGSWGANRVFYNFLLFFKFLLKILVF